MNIRSYVVLDIKAVILKSMMLKSKRVKRVIIKKYKKQKPIEFLIIYDIMSL
ncbi:MAG: hypothetical protein ACI8WT_004376 [Clostridium sp.]|jgi:hypothetical protein